MSRGSPRFVSPNLNFLVKTEKILTSLVAPIAAVNTLQLNMSHRKESRRLELFDIFWYEKFEFYLEILSPNSSKTHIFTICYPKAGDVPVKLCSNLCSVIHWYSKSKHKKMRMLYFMFFYWWLCINYNGLENYLFSQVQLNGQSIKVK